MCARETESFATQDLISEGKEGARERDSGRRGVEGKNARLTLRGAKPAGMRLAQKVRNRMESGQ